MPYWRRLAGSVPLRLFGVLQIPETNCRWLGKKMRNVSLLSCGLSLKSACTSRLYRFSLNVKNVRDRDTRSDRLNISLKYNTKYLLWGNKSN